MHSETSLRLAWMTGLVAVLAACGPNLSHSPSVPPAMGAKRAMLGGATLLLARGGDPSPAPSPQVSLPAGHPPLGGPSLPPGHPALDAKSPSPLTAKAGAPLLWKAPLTWVSETPSSAMRRAQYRVPGPGGNGECVVFYFGAGQGGDATSNAVRWASQFQPPEGQKTSPAPKTAEETSDGGLPVLMVEVTGTFIGGMGGAEAAERRGYMLLGAIAKGPDANWFFKLVGPETTLRAERAHFEQMIRSLRPGA